MELRTWPLAGKDTGQLKRKKKKSQERKRGKVTLMDFFSHSIHSIFLNLQCGFTGFYLLAVHVQNEHKTSKTASQILITFENWVNIY